MSERALVRNVLVGSLLALALAACGSVHRAGERLPPTGGGAALVKGHVSWPDCPRPAANCPSLDGVPIHFADAAANQTFTATSDGSGRYSIQLQSGSYAVIAGNADRSPYQRQVAVQRGDVITLDLLISPPTGLAG